MRPVTNLHAPRHLPLKPLVVPTLCAVALAVVLATIIADLPNVTTREVTYGFGGCFVGYIVGLAIAWARENREARCGR
jgi:urea transporter